MRLLPNGMLGIEGPIWFRLPKNPTNDSPNDLSDAISLTHVFPVDQLFGINVKSDTDIFSIAFY